jgi:glutamyl-tRNA synthetase
LDHDHPIEWDDLIRGHQKFDPKLISDPVVRRADGSWLYLLPSVIDDIDLEITNVVRGEDHVSNSAVQLQMFAALGASPPKLAHEALLVAAEGKLSKRLGSYGAEHLREEGVEPMALLSLLARIGTSEPVEALPSIESLAATFDFAHFGRAPAHFDPHDVELLNAKLLHHLDYADVADRLPQAVGEAEWLVLRGNLGRLAEAGDWVPVLGGEIDPPEVVPDDKPLIEEAARVAEAVDWDGDPWHALTDQLKASTGRKGRALFRPLRLAITGRESGPEMAPLIKLIGKDKAVKRLRESA